MTRCDANWPPGSTRAEVGAVLSLAVLSLVFFVVFPSFDLTISEWFYTPGTGFDWGRNQIVRALYYVVLWVPRLALIGLALVVACSFVVRKGWLRTHRLRLIFIFVAGASGAGTVVNLLMKEHWGRARPASIVQFGGTAHYTPPYEISTQCPRNCAFTSGHAATAFSLLAFGRLRSVNAKRARRRWLIIGIGAGTLVGLARIAQGAHFLSDVVFGFFVVYAVIEIVDLVFQWIITARERPSEASEPAKVRRQRQTELAPQ